MTREAMVFPFRWARSLAYLDDADFRRMFTAIIDYAENGEEPQFSGALGAVWAEIAQRIDADSDKYYERCERNRENAKKRWMPSDANACHRMRMHANGCETMRSDAKNADADPDADADLKKKPPFGGKEKAPADAVASTTTEKNSPHNTENSPYKETFVESSLKPTADFGRWSEEQFRRSVSAAVEKHREYGGIVEEFSRYWLEPDRRGKYRFALEKTWSTAGRLATWYQRSMNDRNGKGRQPLNAAGEGEWRI